MISKTTALKRMLVAFVVCLVAAAIVAYKWGEWFHPSFTGGAYSDFKFFPHGLFLLAGFVAFVLGASDSVFRQLLFVEAFLICFCTFIVIYGFIASVLRRDKD
jgi:F0F1-type ATP synthase assembly protein I